VPTVNTSGAKIFLSRNPPPALDTIESFFMRHFMSLLSEVVNNALPVTRVIKYGHLVGIVDVEEFTDIMLTCYGTYFSGVSKIADVNRQRKKK